MVSKFKKPAGAEEFIKASSGIATDIRSDINTNTDIGIKNHIGINSNINADIYPWQKHNKKSVRKKVFNLKINDYYLEAIRYLANPEEGVSMQNIVQEILIKELDKRIKEAETK